MLRFDEWKQDALYAARMLGRTPGFSVFACLTLTLGIGAATAVFSVVNAVLLRPLPYKQADSLVSLAVTDPGDSRSGVSWQTFEFVQSQNRSFSDVAAYYRNTGWSRVTIGGSDEPESVQAGFTSSSLFNVLGVSPASGRVFNLAEEQNRETLAVLSHGLWKRRFREDPNAIGRIVDVDGRAFTIIGVMPPEFQFPARETQLWLPITTHRLWNDRPQRDDVHTRGYYMRWNVIGRLRSTVTTAAAMEELRHLCDRLSGEDREWNMGPGLMLVPLTIEIGGNARLALFVLLGSVCVVLLIACANLATLMLARGAHRAREIAIRAALGATQGRIIRQLLTESLVLVIISASGALIVAAAVVKLLIRYGPPDLPRLEEASIDGRVLFFMLGISTLAAMLFGILPAIRAGRSDPNNYLKSGGRTATADMGQLRASSLLIVSEFALAVLLLTASGLLLRSLRAVGSVPLGFNPDSVLTLRIRLPDAETAARKAEFAAGLLARFGALPQVESVGGINALFEPGRPPLNSLRSVEGRAPDQRSGSALTWATVSGQYFKAMGITLLSGRYFRDGDTASSPLVAIIDEAMARRYWQGENPVGKRFKGQDARGKNDDWLTVIGVVNNARRQGLEQEPTPHVYEWHRQAGLTNEWVIRSNGEIATLSRAVRAVVRDLAPGAVVSNHMTMRQQLESQTAARRFQTWLLSLFAAIALFLSMAGIYGVISYATGQRTQEIGIRMAVGARRSSILVMVLCKGATLALTGVALGLGAALALTQFVAGLLYGVSPTDPVTFSGVAILLIGVSVVATLAPAIRATQVNPLTALRAE
ncbi:MAG: ABC transporter permease [Bryobacteraceae bacterium]|nr:ABC transporter permease [Bryobacteraceae bacterium]